MSFSKKLTSVILSICMVISVLTVAIVPAAADTTYETYAQDTIQGGNILHCFDWSYNNIKANLADIAKAGYTAVQTSPVQSPKDYNSSWTDGANQWWKLYQPLGFSISDGSTWLGTKAELTSLCTEAEKYNIKVVVDIVSNHLANNGADGGTYSYLNSGVESDLKNSNYYHTSNNGISDDNRYTITQYHLGMPDLNTGNSYVQQKALGLLEECIDCGVDGFRFDAAKHIELPTDPSVNGNNYASQFWPTVINGAKSYASSKGVDEPFFYGEILGSAGTDISNYTTYMAVTDNYTGDRALDKAFWTAASELADGTYYKGASADKSVLWVESHDTYMGSSGSAWTGNTQFVTSDVINKAWAIVGARADSTALFFARPNSTMGAASSDTNWKSTEVAEVNKFKNHFEGTSEYIASSGSTAYIERGTKGVVISKLDGGGSVSLTANQMANGTYTDQVTGNTFTVENGVISGTVGSAGVAVVYNASDDAISYITESTLYLKPNSNWTQASARFAMYVYNSATGTNAWADLTDSDGDGYYSADVPSGDWTNVIFVRMNPSSEENRWDAYDGEGHVWNQTNDLFPDTNTNCYTIASGAWSNGDGTWSLYQTEQTTTSESTTAAPTTAESTTPSGDTYTIYAINNAGWNKVNVHYWGDGETSWPGTAMTSYSGTKVYKFDIPKNVSGLVFTNGASSSTKQTVDITSGIEDGAIWTIGSASSNNYPVSAAPDYYLVGSMNNWSNNNSYKFSLVSSDSGKLEYKLSGVQLSANAEIKVHSNSDSWYPSGSNNNYTVSSDGTYDIYFRPNGDGNSDWHENYFYLVDVTAYTITWKDGDGNTLKTDTVTKGNTPEYTGDTPTKTSTVDKVYTFNNTWSPAITAATADATYTAQFDESTRTYTVTWKNYDGTTLETDTAEYGSTPSYNGETPTRPADGNTTYTFSGWSPQITNETTVTGDVTYTARFSTNTQSYTIRWFNGDGELLKTETCIQGVTPQYTGATPTKTATDQYSYTFNNTWDPPLVAADRDTDYTAQFDSTVNKYTITWKDGNGDTLKTNEVEYGTTPAYNGTTPTKYSDANYTYSFNGTWSPAITSVTQNATYTAQFDATPIPTYTVYATNVVDWSNVYLYYWTDFGDNSWPGVKMTPDGDNFIWSAEIPANAKGIVFTNGGTDSLKQTVNIESGITDGAHWAILNEKDTTETQKYKVHAVPTYYLVGTMTDWGTTNAPTFTPIKNENGLEEYKASNVALSKDTEVKVYGGDAWYPGGDNYTVPETGIYDIYFRPHGDGNDDWYEGYFYLVNVTEYQITWKDGDGNTLKTDAVRYGDIPEYTGDTPTKTTDDQYEYVFNNTWSPEIVAATEDATYTAQFTQISHNIKDTWTWTKTGDTYSVTLELSCENDGCDFTTTIPVPASNINSEVTTEPSCTETGVRTYTATYEFNGRTYTSTQTDSIPASGHNMTAHPAHAATCTGAGNYEYWSCDRCNKYFSDENGENEIAENSWVISATGHSYGQPVWHWITYGNAEAVFTCGTCGNEETVAAYQIVEGESNPPTCSENGYIEYTAYVTFEGQSYSDTVYKPLQYTGHNMTYHPASEASYAAAGNTAYYSCSKCNHYFSDDIGLHEIEENSWVIPRLKVAYLDENGDTQHVYADPITAETTALTAGWYYVDGDVTVNSDITITGDVKVILTDDNTLTVDDSNFGTSKTNGSALTFYSQSKGSQQGELYASSVMAESVTIVGGKINASNSISTGTFAMSGGNLNAKTIVSVGDITFSGGEANVDGRNGENVSSSSYNAISSYNGNVLISGGSLTAYGHTCILAIDDSKGTVTITGGDTILVGYGTGMLAKHINITGGKVYANATDTAHGGAGISSYNEITLSWTDADNDYIFSNGYDSNSDKVTILKPFYDQNNRIYEIGSEDEDTLASKGLNPYNDIGIHLAGHSISLDGSIGVNFYMELSPEVIENQDNAYMHFTIPKNGEPGVQDVYVKDAETKVVGDKTYYIFTCNVAAKEIESEITAQLFSGNDSSLLYKYSVKQYADYLIDHQDDNETFKKAVPLVQAMMDYGENARYYFDKTGDKPADINVTIPDYDRTIYENNLPEGVTFGGATLSLKSETTLSLYFNSDHAITLTCEDTGDTYETEQTGSNEYVIRIRNIAAYELDKTFTVDVDGVKAAEYSALAYCCRAQNNSNTKLANTVKALYVYWQQAVMYFNENQEG